MRSDYLAEKLMDHLHGKAAFTVPTIFIGLSTTKPNKNGTGITEPAAADYDRVETAAVDWGVSIDGLTANATAQSFAEAVDNWGVLLWLVRFDALSGGNFLDAARLGRLETVLAEELDESETIIDVDDAFGLPSSGTIQVDDEDITYTGVTGLDSSAGTDRLTGCTRGANGTTPHAHASGSEVFLVMPKAITVGDTLSFAIGNLQFDLR